MHFWDFQLSYIGTFDILNERYFDFNNNYYLVVGLSINLDQTLF